ncbi:MAG: hypothetical protein ACRDPJ_04230 [Nocardioidaceae bacterium]
MIVRTRRLVVSGLTALTLATVAAGCGAETEPGDPARAGAVASPTVSAAAPSPAQTSSSAAVSPTPTPSETESAVQTQQAAPPEQIPTKDRLLTAEEVPGFNDEFTWSAGATRMREGNRPFGTCHKFAMASIGATKVAVRDFAPAEKAEATAANLVAEFADEATAKRAFAVLKSWREQCGEELRSHDRSDVGSLQDVPVPPGATGGWYLLTYGPAGGDESYFDAQGLTRVGTRISLLELRLFGQDYNYPAGKEPMVAAVSTAAGKLG